MRVDAIWDIVKSYTRFKVFSCQDGCCWVTLAFQKGQVSL